MHRPSLGRRFTRAVTLCTLAALGLLLTAGSSPGGTAVGHETYTVTNLVSDGTIPAAHTDANLVNAWGLTATGSSPWWVANNATGTSTLYNGDGVAQFPPTPLVVNVPNAPTGAVANTTSDFLVSSGGPKAVFIFATEDGTIRGWNPGVPPPPLSTQSFVVVDKTGEGAVFKGLAIAGDRIFAADFHNAKVDVFDSSFAQITGGFVDPKIPSGYG